MKGRVQTKDWTADIETNAESAKRLIAFVLAAKRLNSCSFAQGIDRIRFAINTKYSVAGDQIIAETWFTHPVVNEEAFESFALRLRPIIYDRDVCHFEKVVAISRSMLASSPEALAELEDIEALYQSKSLSDQLARMETLAQAVAASKWPIVNLWNVVFGGNLWMRKVFHDELFRYGFLYHWNAQNDKWMDYREIEKAAGGRENFLRCMIPFFQCQHLAITRLQRILSPALQAVGLGNQREELAGNAAEAQEQSTPATTESASVPAVRAISEGTDETPAEELGPPVLDVHQIVRSLLPDQYLIERHSWMFKGGEMKRTLSLEASDGVRPPQVTANTPMEVAPAGIMVDYITAGETSVTLEAKPYMPRSVAGSA
ncbi:hypothetical protein SAMN05216573_122101 [Bradyrhizobium sp. Rc3b]|uniref:hypothetical protein n=1 Tax=Bradyrhizobium sp. Rc3b TaxID=1855322 RepID=UPI0008E80B00|nr:hypothetical protein [Bradyrhizobium sp. Rc3b]SFN81828.1 hypothetical protein SAMN05216573_122101 [Bradyrhizobium sp. Rc3b]